MDYRLQRQRKILSYCPELVDHYKVVLEEGSGPETLTVLSFPNRASIQALFSDPAYKALIPARDRGFNRIGFFVANEPV